MQRLEVLIRVREPVMSITILKMKVRSEVMIDLDLTSAEDGVYPLQVLKNMQAREQFIKGQIESIFVDKSIDWQEYMYIRRTRLEYGISDEEFEYFANSLYEGQMSDRSKVEDDKHEKEKEEL